MSVDLIVLAEKREAAREDKAELFDFYHHNWDRLIAEILRLKAISDQHDRQGHLLEGGRQ